MAARHYVANREIFMDSLTSKIYREGWLAHEKGAKYESNPYSKTQMSAFCAWCAGWNDYSTHNYKRP